MMSPEVCDARREVRCSMRVRQTLVAKPADRDASNGNVRTTRWVGCSPDRYRRLDNQKM